MNDSEPKLTPSQGRHHQVEMTLIQLPNDRVKRALMILLEESVVQAQRLDILERSSPHEQG